MRIFTSDAALIRKGKNKFNQEDHHKINTFLILSKIELIIHSLIHIRKSFKIIINQKHVNLMDLFRSINVK